MFTPSGNTRRTNAPRKRVENRAERKLVTKSATICIDGAEMVMPCTIRDIHNQGARLSVANPQGIPDNFLIICRAEDLVARAIAAWRKPNEMGVKFLRSGPLYEEERFRKEQHHSYQKDLQAAEQKRQQAQAAYEAQQAQEEARRQQALQYQRHLMQMIGIDDHEPLTEEVLKTAYRREAMTRHPDQGGSMEAFQELNNIYQYLMAQIVPQQQPAAAIAL